MDVVVVESPAKAKTINKYLGTNYHVLASYGHIRDLPAKDGSVDPENDFDMKWELNTKGKERIKTITGLLKEGGKLFLATDPDREGEAIAWHLYDALSKKIKDLPGRTSRVVFNEITKSAVIEAFDQPRQVNDDLVKAYLARRSLDYLVGFNISPILWRKLPGARSAGRVQSVALRLICERENAIEKFIPTPFWTIDTDSKYDGKNLAAHVSAFDGKSFKQNRILNEDDANKIEKDLKAAKNLNVSSIEKKQVGQNPAPPFTTSTLQQEANRKMGFGADRTMRTAQKLYEGVKIGGEVVGLITYMRTDSVHLSQDALNQCRDYIEKEYDKPYLPEKPRFYKNKSKNAQEAHEAVRPTTISLSPKKAAAFLDEDGLKLYTLIWKRTVACQMAGARIDRTRILFNTPSGVELRATGSIIAFNGFMTLYQESFDDTKEEKDRVLPDLKEGDVLPIDKVILDAHQTQPPPRFTEASLVKNLEEHGIGRPSTYASIIKVLQDRDYVILDKKRFMPEDRGRIVTSFLSHYFPRYIAYDFTASLEEELDDIAVGERLWLDVLNNFWTGFISAVEETKNLRITEVIDVMDADLAGHFFPNCTEDEKFNPRTCPKCEGGRLGIKFSKNGGFIGCSNYPECSTTFPLTIVTPDVLDGVKNAKGSQVLTKHPELGTDVTLKKGPYGWYLECEIPGEKKPKRVSIPKQYNPDEVDAELAEKLIGLPRLIGMYENLEIHANFGRYGGYLQWQEKYFNLPKEEHVLEVGLNRAIAVIDSQKDKKVKAADKIVGKHPKTNRDIVLKAGRYGPYLKYSARNYAIPKEQHEKVSDMSIEDFCEILDTKKKAK